MAHKLIKNRKYTNDTVYDTHMMPYPEEIKDQNIKRKLNKLKPLPTRKKHINLISHHKCYWTIKSLTLPLTNKTKPNTEHLRPIKYV